MAFNFIEGRFNKAVKKAQSKGQLSEENINELLDEIRLILLESDVNLQVTNEFIDETREKCLGTVVDSDRTASQTVLKIVNEELVKLLGGETYNLSLANRPSTVMFVGLQGSGKTTTSAKFAKHMKDKEGKFEKPMLVALDVYRPAAIDQLEKLANDLGYDFYADRGNTNVKEIAEDAMIVAERNGNDLIILDTAGRLQTDEELMVELEEVKEITKPEKIIFVADGMSGQEITNVASTFNERLNVSGTVITKLDSNAKGGAALSISAKENLPIIFVGTGEKIDDLEKFHPDRMAGRLLGLGDIETLTEKAQEVGSEDSNERMMRKIMSGRYDLDDLLESMEQMASMGSMKGIAKMMPGMKVNDAQLETAEKKVVYYRVLISSMTAQERKNPKLLKSPKRKARIIKGSGRTPQEFNDLTRSFEKSQKQMKQVAQMLKSNQNISMEDLKRGMM